MERESQHAAYCFLLDLSAKQGYITFDDIMSSADKWNLAISAVDWLSSEITTRGILVYDEAPSSYSSTAPDEDFNDYAQSDYELIFRKAIEVEPAFEKIISDIKNIVPPQYKEISQLKYQITEGNDYARNRMIEMHLRLAVKIALQRSDAFGLELADTFGWACIGLITAVDRYNPDVNGAFGSYASLWMLQCISREQPTQNPNIYFPVHKREGYYTLYPLLKERGCTSCDKMPQCAKLHIFIKNEMEYTSEQVADVLLASFLPYSLDMFSENMDEECENIDIGISAFEKFSSDESILLDKVYESMLSENITKALSSLKERERDVLIDRYGLNGHTEKTLEEIGSVLNVTRERVRQIEAKALRKLRNTTISKTLKEYY